MLSDRRTFLHLIAAASGLQPRVNAAPQAGAAIAAQLPFPIRVLDDCAAALRCALCTVGDRLGLFRLMEEAGPVTSEELARRAQLNARILREWLNSMAAADYIDYRPADKTYTLAKDHALGSLMKRHRRLFSAGCSNSRSRWWRPHPH